MYITISDVTGKKTIDLSYPIWAKEVAVISMLSNNIQYWLNGPIEVLLKTRKKIVLSKGAYTDKGLNSLIGLELKSIMDDRDDVLRTDKLEKVTKMVFSLDELDNSDNLENGKPSSILFMYHVSSPEYFTCFEPVTPQYKKLKNGRITSLVLKIRNQNGNIITNRLGTTVVLHIHDCKL